MAGGVRLPAFLAQRYTFLRASLIDHPILFMVDESLTEEPPATIIDPAFRARLAPTIKGDMRRCIQKVEDEPPDLRAFGLGEATLDSVLGMMRETYGLDGSPRGYGA